MQKSNNQSDEKNPAVPVDTLRPYIVADNIDEFNRTLTTPVDHDIFLQLLEIALQHRAVKIIGALSEALHTASKSKSKLSGKNSRRLIQLVSMQYAEIFRSNAMMLKIQLKFLENITTPRYKDLLLAAITGDLDVFKKLSEIPELSSVYCPLIAYAAANNHVSVVRYLHEHKHDPHQQTYHCNAMVAAIINNATTVFDYLIETPFDPNKYIHVDSKWPCHFPVDIGLGTLLKISVCYKRFDQFVKLVTKGAKLSAEIIDIATKLGAEDIVSYCLEKSNPPAVEHTMEGVSVDTNHSLFSAIALNKKRIVQELISLKKADITAVNKQGENVLFIAANNDTLEIFEYLLEQLKATLTPEKLSEFLNTKSKSGWNILGHLSKHNKLRSPGNEKLISILKNLVALGTALFADTKDAKVKILTYPGDMSPYPFMSYLNFLAANILLQKFNTTGLPLTYLDVSQYLFHYFNNMNPSNNEFMQQHRPDIAALRRCANNLFDLTTFKNIIIENRALNTDKHYSALCYALASSVDNTCAILPNLVDELTSQNLQLLTHTILALPNFFAKSQLCLALANRIYAIADARANAREFHNHLTFDVRLFIAKTLYSDTSIQQDETIANNIKACNKKLDVYQFQPDANLLQLMQPITDIKTKCNRLLLQSAINLNSIWLLDYFITTYDASCFEIKAIIFSCLQTKDPNEEVRKLVGKLLNKLAENNPSLLLILAHALSYFKVMKQREQTKTIFTKALAQLANIKYSESDTLEQLSHTYPKETLIAVLKIRVELVELFGKYRCKINTVGLSSLHQSEFLSKHKAYLLIISQFMQEQKALPTILLDTIEQDCIRHLNQSIAAEPAELKEPITGKRPATEDLTGASSPKRPLDESYQFQL